MASPKPRRGILEIAPYVPGRSKADGLIEVRKLSSNEGALGSSPKAIAAYHAAADRLFRYPDGNAAALRASIAARYGLKMERIICGAGSDDILMLLALAYVGTGDEVVMTRHGFLVYEIVTRAAGGSVIKAAETDLRANVDALLKIVTPKTRIVFLANPNNPTGTYLPAAELKRLHNGLPPDVLLVIDAAYAEFVRRNDYDSGIELVAENENVIMTRTFSKIYGLAGLRIGWAYGPAPVIDALNRIRGPFNASIPAEAAAVAALEDRAFIDNAVAHNEYWLGWLGRELAALGLRMTPSVANFHLVDFGKRAGAIEADLAARGILVRGVGAYGLPDHLRISVGRESDNRALIAALRQIL